MTDVIVYIVTGNYCKEDVTMVNKIKVSQCQGEGQGTCKRCYDNGHWNRCWMSFLYKIDGLEGCYCRDCKNFILAELDKLN